MVRDRPVVGMEREQEVICALSNGDIFNDLDELLTQFSRSQHFFYVEYLKNGACYGQSYYRRLIGNHT